MYCIHSLNVYLYNLQICGLHMANSFDHPSMKPHRNQHQHQHQHQPNDSQSIRRVYETPTTTPSRPTSVATKWKVQQL